MRLGKTQSLILAELNRGKQRRSLTVAELEQGTGKGAATIRQSLRRLAASGLVAKEAGRWSTTERVVLPSRVASLEAFVAACAKLVDESGWVSRTQAKRDGVSATADLAIARIRDGEQASAQELEAAREVVDVATRALSKKCETDYERKLRDVLDRADVTVKSAGYAASLVGFAKRVKTRSVAASEWRAIADASKFMGSVGQRLEFRAKVVAMRDFTGHFGDRCRVQLVTDDGAVVTWWANMPAARIQCKVGETKRMRATVKGHSINRYERPYKETTVERLAICGR